MSQNIHNPFSPAPSAANGSGHAGNHRQDSQPQVSGNPFQALERAAEANNPFAAADGNFETRSAGGQSGRPAKLPDPRPVSNDGFQAGGTSGGSGNPFELVDTDRSPSSTYSPQGFQPAPDDNRREQARPEMMPEPPAPRQNYEEPRRQPDSSAPHHGEQQSSFQGYQGYYGTPSSPQAQPQRTRTPIRQLELRAIFGVNHELSREEIIQRARTLPGVRNLSIIDEQGANAVTELRDYVSRLGFGDRDSLYLASSSGSIDFIEEGDATLAVLYEGSYAPGVRETLIIVTRELAKLS